MSALPLTGRVALVTGVSRRIAIGHAVAERLTSLGATVVASGFPEHDAAMAWGGEPPLDGVEGRDLAEVGAPEALVDAVVDRHGALDVVVAAHARSSDQPFGSLTADELDGCWAANVRSIVLLAQRFAARHERSRPGGRLVWFTSGQHLSPMQGELAYAISKGALHQMTWSLADALAAHGIVANCINPGPVDTGYATGDVHESVRRRFPSGRWGQPSDVANLVEFLVRDEGAWIQGQVLDSEGGFRRWG